MRLRRHGTLARCDQSNLGLPGVVRAHLSRYRALPSLPGDKPAVGCPARTVDNGLQRPIAGTGRFRSSGGEQLGLQPIFTFLKAGDEDHHVDRSWNISHWTGRGARPWQADFLAVPCLAK